MKLFSMKPTTKRVIRYLLLALFIYIIYVILSVTLPFIHGPKVNDEYKNQFSTNKFYSDTVGVDRASIIESSQDALDIRLHMMEQAKKELIISSFSIKNDKSCIEIASVIFAAANRGVKVKIIGDGLTCTIDMKDDPIYYALANHPNVEIRFYNIPSLLKPWEFNGRLHDKYIIVDDKLLLLGGRNISNYFLGNYNPNVLSYDRDIFVYNTANATDDSKESVISQVQSYFQTIWDSKDSEIVFESGCSKKAMDAAILTLEDKYKQLISERKSLFEPRDYTNETIATNQITLVSNPIHIMSKQPYVWYELSELMKKAKEDIYIQTPYAVLNNEMYQTLTHLSETVPSVTILLNSVAGGDNVCASTDYTFHRKKILRTNVSIYEFQGSHSMHNKSIAIDHDLSVIGSYNLDLRSTYLDTEVMLVVHGEEFNQELRSCMDSMEQSSLLVKKDGSYAKKEGVTPLPLSTGKKMLFGVGSVFFQLIRYLL